LRCQSAFNFHRQDTRRGDSRQASQARVRSWQACQSRGRQAHRLRQARSDAKASLPGKGMKDIGQTFDHLSSAFAKVLQT
jgi:hypothetical protein